MFRFLIDIYDFIIVLDFSYQFLAYIFIDLGIILVLNRLHLHTYCIINLYFLFVVPLDINECQSSPCRNGGTCVDRVNGYECTCAPGYGDTRCETSKLI